MFSFDGKMLQTTKGPQTSNYGGVLQKDCSEKSLQN